jgi:predicted lysophospholipase L1 biosynthesis ABC-type transport system permease subunit
MTLTPRWRKALLTLHVVTAVGWLGTDFVMLFLAAAGVSGADPAVVYPAISLIGLWVFMPLSFVVWIVGVLNSLLTPWGLFRHWWVVVKLAVTTLMLVLVVFALRPGLLLMGDLGADLPDADRAGALFPPVVSTTLMLFATVLSTYKPWGRVRRTGPRAAVRPVPDGRPAPAGTRTGTAVSARSA